MFPCQHDEYEEIGMGIVIRLILLHIAVFAFWYGEQIHQLSPVWPMESNKDLSKTSGFTLLRFSEYRSAHRDTLSRLSRTFADHGEPYSHVSFWRQPFVLDRVKIALTKWAFHFDWGRSESTLETTEAKMVVEAKQRSNHVIDLHFGYTRRLFLLEREKVLPRV